MIRFAVSIPGGADSSHKNNFSKNWDKVAIILPFLNSAKVKLQRDALPLFNMLRKTYKSSIDIEPVLNELLDGIAEKFYGVRRRNPLQGIFGDFFKSFATLNNDPTLLFHSAVTSVDVFDPFGSSFLEALNVVLLTVVAPPLSSPSSDLINLADLSDLADLPPLISPIFPILPSL
ncbi:hypothetical protein TEA_026352 [Camellia sinensis var. sinensis]|uniref:Uncharacterized protein n=1 Tax=Camellia sinensis var. sinensis TaxID=542762 RepID=A0A4S4F212_CAMSN|nr:hypothetical protein TEA_026352 [Camellia sinensis var. sinensis]